MSRRGRDQGVFFKSQQRGEPDLTPEQRRTLAAEVLDRSPALFLARFGGLLRQRELDLLEENLEEDYEVRFHLRKLRSEGCKFNRNRRVKNRR